MDTELAILRIELASLIEQTELLHEQMRAVIKLHAAEIMRYRTCKAQRTKGNAS